MEIKKPTNNRIVIEPIKADADSLLIIPEGIKENPMVGRGKVLQVGELWKLKEPEIEPEVHVGDTVLYLRPAAVEVDGMWFIYEHEIFAVIEG
jgi:co-chaperonin GroES (HSP10)